MSLVSDTEAFRFMRISDEIRAMERERKGIGTLGEKTVHAVIKRYMEPDEDYHEIPVDGFVADIYQDGRIIEIQTGNFNRLRKKLESFLENYDVTVVYPIPRIKYLKWLDPETGELSGGRKSPKTGTPYMAFKELYRIRNFLQQKNLHFCILMIDMEEIRLLNGWSRDRKKGSERFDRYPLALVEQISIEQREDFFQMIPAELNEIFSVVEYAKAAGISKGIAGLAVLLLKELGLLEMVGKKGKAYLYKIRESI